jgi:ornithine--oxo-acid transaminase
MAPRATPSSTAATTAATLTSSQHIELTERYVAHNYHSLPAVLTRGEGVWVTDVEGNRYMDFLAAYSAVNFGHGNRELIAAAKAQLEKLTLTSRAFFNDQLGPFSEQLAALCRMEAVLPMNSGAEGVEAAIKTARKWGHLQRGIPQDRGKILACARSFHGRTTTIISFSTDPQARRDYGPWTPGFEIVEFGSASALEHAIDRETIAFLVEPIQGEAGVIIPPSGYLKRVREICTKHNILFIADEIQSGLGRTGKTFACDHEDVQPDLFILGKALGGGIMPVSAVVGHWDVLGVFKPGDHGSTFGGNPLACAIGQKVIEILRRGDYQDNSRNMGDYMRSRIDAIGSNKVKEIRNRGLWFGIEFKPGAGKARPYCEQLLELGMLCKDTHEQTMRLAPPLCITRDEVDEAVSLLERVLR